MKSFTPVLVPNYKRDGCGYSDSGKLCPKCLAKGVNKYMKNRTNTKTGEKFYSCVAPNYGDGCGHTENLE